MRLRRAAGLGVIATLALPCTVLAQFPSAVVGFNGPPIDDEATSQEMFRLPEFSGTTATFILANAAGQFNNNVAYRASGLQTEGAASLEVFFRWVDPADPDAWLRLTSFAGPERPNPALDTRGKVRFKLANRSELFNGDIGVCLGVRETGGNARQLEDGGTTGPIEWVGTSTTINGITAGADGIVNTPASGDDVQEYPVGFDTVANGLPTGTAVVSPGTNGVMNTTPAGDDTNRSGFRIGANGGRQPVPAIILAPSPAPYTLEWDLTTGVVRVNGTPMGGGLAAFTGNGTLADSPDNRGVLEHIAFTNVADDTAVLIDVGIDELQVEATVPDPTPPPTIQSPVVETDTTVRVDTGPGATLAELFRNGTDPNDSLGTAVPVANVATFNGLSLDAGDVLRATQTANAIESGPSAPVLVFAQGVVMADNFDSYETPADLNQFWFNSINSPTPADARVRLQPGGAASCPNFLREESPANANAARLYRGIGGVNGTDADPLEITWHFRFTGTEGGAGARTRCEVAHFNGGGFNTGNRGDGTVGITLFNQVGGALFDEHNLTIRATDPNDPARIDLLANGWVDAAGFLRAPSGVAKQPGVWHKMSIEVLSDVFNFYIDDVLVNPAPYAAGVPRPNPDAGYDFIIIGEGFSNNGPRMHFDNVAVTQGAAFPFGDPEVPAPEIVAPLLPSIATVSLFDVDPNATGVDVFSDGGLIGSAAGPFPGGTADVTVSPDLVNGATIIAVQTVGGQESCGSIPVDVAVTPVSILNAVLVPGQTSVQVGDIELGLASQIIVQSNDTNVIGTLNNPATDPVAVTTTPLQFGATITATQVIDGVEGPLSAGVQVTVPAPTVDTPLVDGDQAVRVIAVHPLATSVAVQVNGAPAGSAPATGAEFVTVPVGAALEVNDEVTATQTIGGFESGASAVVFVEVPFCQIVFEDNLNLDSSANWNVLIHDNASQGDASATFAVDYSTLGVPPSPNGGGSTRGVRLDCNAGGIGSPAAVTMTPVGLSLSAATGYRLTFDMWINANGPFPAGGAGSTQNYTCGVGHDDATVLQGPPDSSVGATAQTGIGAWFQITGEGGAADDVRGFKDVERQYPASTQYAAGTGSLDDSTNGVAFYAALFGDPGPAPPAAQTSLFPSQTGNTLAGSAGFAWHEVSVTVLGARARWEINGVPIITIDTTLGNPFSGLDGNVAIGYEDSFSSLSGNPIMSFGLVDNVKVLVAGPFLGDLDGDFAVTLTDLAIQLSNFGTLVGADPEDGDLDGDGDVDLTDLAVLLSAFGTFCE